LLIKFRSSTSLLIIVI